MKQRKRNIISRFAGFIFGLIAALGFCFIFITAAVINHYHNAGIQLLNKDVAAHIAKFASPFAGGGIDTIKADSVFYNAMVLSPAAEVYFLDTSGKIMAYHHDEIAVSNWKIPLPALQEYIDSKGEKYIRAADPRDPGHDKIFSAAEVLRAGKRQGYIYVILNSKKSADVVGVPLGNHVFRLALLSFIAVIGLSLVFSLLYLRRTGKNYRKLLAVIERFEDGDYSARFPVKKNKDPEPVTHAFNAMADLLSSSISKLTGSEEERKNFIATISHDLRTPLAIARGYAETLMINKEGKTVRQEEIGRYSTLIYEKLLQIEKMVMQLFELSKIEAVEFKPNKEPFVLSEILQEAVNTFQHIAAEKNVGLKCTQCLYHVWTNADVSMMERVVQNLIENALKSTPAGGKVDVWLEVVNKELVLYMANTGELISPALAAWVNGSSDRLASFSNRPSGAGLGLIIVQRILHLHGSALTVSTSTGRNLFSFRLPVYMQPESAL